MNCRHLTSAGCLLIWIALAGTELRAVGPVVRQPAPPKLGPFDLKMDSVPVKAVIQLLRDRECSPISFVDVAHPTPISLDLRRVTAAEVLRQIAKSNSAFRAETIDGRDVLYPARPEFQKVVDGVVIQSIPRLDASYDYLDRLNKEVPAFADLGPPFVFGDSRHPILSDRVSLRPKGRVIEHLVDLLGEDRALYFEFTRAMSGVPELLFQWVNCAGSR
jgi:hypothetical protein